MTHIRASDACAQLEEVAAEKMFRDAVMNRSNIGQIKRAVDDSLARVRKHPFIEDANADRLQKIQAIRWIMCAGRESRSFPLILEGMIATVTKPAVRAALQRNLDDEYGHGNPQDVHFHHYLHLLDALGIDRADFDQYAESAGIRLALSLAYNIAAGRNEAVALGYMLVNEGMTQITYEAVQNAIAVHYGPLSIPFFEIYTTVDERHLDELFEVVEILDEEQLGDVLFGIQIGERGMAVLLDEAYGMYDHVTKFPTFAPVTSIAA
jgi:pyrroloquinoline quinone (PQQ) biosynthesis protein C